MTKNEKLLEAAREAIDALFSDTSVSPEKTEDGLRDLRTEIEFKLKALEADRRRGA